MKKQPYYIRLCKRHKELRNSIKNDTIEFTKIDKKIKKICKMLPSSTTFGGNYETALSKNIVGFYKKVSIWQRLKIYYK